MYLDAKVKKFASFQTFCDTKGKGEKKSPFGTEKAKKQVTLTPVGAEGTVT